MRKTLLSLIGLFAGLSIYSAANECKSSALFEPNSNYEKHIIQKDGTIVENLSIYKQILSPKLSLAQKKIYPQTISSMPKTLSYCRIYK